MGKVSTKIILKQELENGYILKNHTIANLKALGFRRYSAMCDEDSSYYIYRFPVNKYLGTTTLEGELKVDSNTGSIRMDIYDMDHDLFIMFYNDCTESNKNFLLEIRGIILKEFKNLGIEKK